MTICAKGRDCVFGEIISNEIYLNNVGKIIESEWVRIAEIRRNVLIDGFMIMTNHLLGIIIIIEPDIVGAHWHVPLHRNIPQT